MAVTLLQATIQESSLVATSSYGLKNFQARYEQFFWLRSGRIQSCKTPQPQTAVASAAAWISMLQEDPTKPLWGSTEI